MSGSCAANEWFSEQSQSRGQDFNPACKIQSIEGLALPIVTPIAKHCEISRSRHAPPENKNCELLYQ